MEITFLRHGKTDLSGKGYIATKLDYHLNKRGIEECNKNIFKNSEFDCVYSSPFLRTTETAKIVYPYNDPIISELITQRDLGELTECFKCNYELEYLKLVRDYVLNPNGAESLEDLISRINLFFEKLNSQKYNKVLVVGHNGIMRIIKKYYLNEEEKIDTENLGQFKLILKK